LNGENRIVFDSGAANGRSATERAGGNAASTHAVILMASIERRAGGRFRKARHAAATAFQ
jgi:hypothetical protein